MVSQLVSLAQISTYCLLTDFLRLPLNQISVPFSRAHDPMAHACRASCPAHVGSVFNVCVSLSLSSWDVFELSHRCRISSCLASDLVPLVVIAGRSRGSFRWSPFLAPLLCLLLWSSRCCLASSAGTWARLHLRTLVGGALSASARDAEKVVQCSGCGVNSIHFSETR